MSPSVLYGEYRIKFQNLGYVLAQLFILEYPFWIFDLRQVQEVTPGLKEVAKAGMKEQQEQVVTLVHQCRHNIIRSDTYFSLLMHLKLI